MSRIFGERGAAVPQDYYPALHKLQPYSALAALLTAERPEIRAKTSGFERSKKHQKSRGPEFSNFNFWGMHKERDLVELWKKSLAEP